MIELQRLLLGDTLRNDAFARALKEVIVPGKTVVADIGSGTGFLSFLAEKLGAKECHGYEVTGDLVKLSQKLAKENGMKRCRFSHTHSTAVKKLPQADVVVSETLGNYALEENIIETMNDARRFLKPGGTVMPLKLRQYVEPVISPRLYTELNVWDHVGHNLDFAAAKEIAMNNMYVKDITPKDVLNQARCWDTIDFTKKNSSIRESTEEWVAPSDTVVYGFALWWEADLTETVTLSTSPFKPSTHWKQIYLPLVKPLSFVAKKKIRVHLHSDSRYSVKIHLRWDTDTTKQDIRKGYIQ
jgi:protein arginine N-methyltransferase 1